MTQAIIVPPPGVAGISGTPPATPPAPPAQAPVQPPATPPATPPAQAGDPPITFDTPPVAPPVAPQPDTVVVYEKTGDTGLDVALRFVGERGFGPDHPAIKAATAGDFGPLEKALGDLGDKAKGFKEYVDLAKDSHTRRQAGVKAKSEATAKVVYDAAGGKEQWSAIQAWAAEHADADEKAELNAALKAGGLAAKSAVTYLAGLYKAHGKTAPKSAVKPDAQTAPAVQTALSPREYAAEVRALHVKLGARMEDSPEYAALGARRRAYRAG